MLGAPDCNPNFFLTQSRACYSERQFNLSIQGKIITDRKNNGISFNVNETKNQIGLGLQSIVERVWLSGGTGQVETGPGDGTIISLGIPLF